MNSVKFLYAAYTATWTIHLLYIWSLLRRYRRLRQQKKELGASRNR
jgi:CcmD family protein